MTSRPHPISKSKRVRLVFLIDSLGMGGAERLMLQYLKHFDRSIFDLRVCRMHGHKDEMITAEIQNAGIPVDLLPVPKLRDVTALPRLVRYLNQQNTELLHTQLEFSDILGMTAARFLRIPVVTTVHCLDQPQPGTRTYWRLKLRWWIMREFCNCAIMVSERTLDHHIRVGKLPASKALALHNGIDLTPFQVLNASAIAAKRAELGISRDAPLLVTVAVLRKPKGLQYMIPALPLLIETVPDLHYLIVGDGEYRETLRQLVAEYGVTDHVTFAGTRKDVPELLGISDLFVLPTLGEALPTVLAEAMAARTPIVVSNVGGVPEMIDPGRNGILVPPSDTIALANACRTLLHDLDRARQMGDEGRAIVEERFNIQSQVRKLENLYLELLRDTPAYRYREA